MSSSEIFRVLKPGGRAIVMVYAENSLHYWRNLMWNIGLKEGQLRKYSMGEIMSRTVERSDNAAAHPLVKVYTQGAAPPDVRWLRRHRDRAAADGGWRGPESARLRAAPERSATIMGWNLVIKARKPAR